MSSNSWVRTVAIGIGVVAAGYGTCKLYKKATRSESNKQLEARQDKARAAIGGGLDDVFAAELDEDSSSVQLTARLDVDAELTAKYDENDCGKGFTQAFEEVLGKDVISVGMFYTAHDSALKLQVTAKVTPSGEDFVLPSSHTPYPGIRLEGDVTLAGKTVHVKVEPGSDISFEYSRMQFDFDKISGAEVAAGILQATCKQAAYAWLEKTTNWRRPEAPPPADPVAECERGFHCVEAADALVAKDPGKAEKLYATACQKDDADACERLARVALDRAPGSDKSLAYITLEMACRQENATACVGGAQVAMIPIHDDGKPGDYERDEATPLALRACDLGERDGCELAAPLFKGTPFAEAAPVLLSGKPITSKKLGKIFALKWGQWSHTDSGQATVWTTTKPPSPPDGASVRELSGDEIPKGLDVPDGASTVYAIALKAGRGTEYDRACERCNPSGGGESIYSMRSFDCVCVLARPARRAR